MGDAAPANEGPAYQEAYWNNYRGSGDWYSNYHGGNGYHRGYGGHGFPIDDEEAYGLSGSGSGMRDIGEGTCSQRVNATEMFTCT